MAGSSIEPAANPGRQDRFDPPSGQPSAADVLVQLNRILSSPIFIQSERLCRFLRITVERTLAGETGQIKEYTLGRDVFDRDQGYDPRIDSIVRVEARRLRAKLRQYYQEAGAGDPVLIGFRKGSYVPIFRYLAQGDGAASSESPFAPTEAAHLDPRTVAVLPFLNLSPDPDQDFFCDGIAEDILNALTTIAELNVVARTSVFHFKGTAADVREIGEKLGAGTVIEGSVRKAGNRLRVSAKVIDAARGVLLWSGTFDREVEDVFAVQDEIARAIAESLRVTLAPPREVFPALRTPGHLEAYTLYLKARHYWYQTSREGTQAAIDHYNRALTLFPDFAPCYAGLADLYTHLTFWGAISPLQGTPLAKRAALDALRLDDRLAEAHATLGAIVSCFEWHWADGVKLLRRALDLQPSNLNAHNFYGFQFLARGLFPEAMVVIERSVKLDPLSPRVSRAKGWAFYFQRLYDKAIDSLKSTLILDERNIEARFLLAYAYLRKTRYEEAATELSALPEGPFSATKLGGLGEVYACWGKTAEARAALEQLDVIAKTGYVSPISRLSIHAGLGEWDRVFEGLEQAYGEHTPWLCLLKVDPRYDPIRPDARVKDLLMRLKLA